MELGVHVAFCIGSSLLVVGQAADTTEQTDSQTHIAMTWIGITHILSLSHTYPHSGTFNAALVVIQSIFMPWQSYRTDKVFSSFVKQSFLAKKFHLQISDKNVGSIIVTKTSLNSKQFSYHWYLRKVSFFFF